MSSEGFVCPRGRGGVVCPRRGSCGRQLTVYLLQQILISLLHWPVLTDADLLASVDKSCSHSYGHWSLLTEAGRVSSGLRLTRRRSHGGRGSCRVRGP